MDTLARLLGLAPAMLEGMVRLEGVLPRKPKDGLSDEGMYHAFWLGMSTALAPLATGGGLGELMLWRLRAPRVRDVEAAAGPRDREREAAEPDPRFEGAVGGAWENGESAVGEARLGVSARSADPRMNA